MAEPLSALPFSHPTMLAPMEGVTSPVLRKAIDRVGGVGVVCTEFIRIAHEHVNSASLQREVVHAENSALSVQLMGRGADWMADAAGTLSEAGADVVDVNMGCPTRRAVKGGVGAAMLRDPALCHEVLTAMRLRVDGLLSAKIRAGFDSPEHAVTIAQTIERAGVDYLVVHPRCRTDLYKGVADWRVVERIRQHIDIPVVGNGDVWYADDALTLEEQTGCHGVMIGRPVLRNPFIFRQIAELRAGIEPFEPSGEDVSRFFFEVLDGYRATYPAHRIIGPMKELFKYLARSVDDHRELAKRGLRADGIDTLCRVVETDLAVLSSAALDLSARGGQRLERSAVLV